MKTTDIVSHKNQNEHELFAKLEHLLDHGNIPKEQRLENLGLFLTSKEMSRLLFMHHIYQLAIPVHGIIAEFGTRFGNNIAMFHAFRSIHEPYNARLRPLVAFDTFQGFCDISKHDGNSPMMKKGLVATPEKQEEVLDEILSIHEQLNPMGHIKKFELVKGDISKTLPQYLKAHPETIVALAYFDTDLYEPTKNALLLLRDRMTQGTVLGFDEAGDPGAPGVTRAIMETLDLKRIKLQRLSWCSRTSFCIVQ
ncbi:crotonobetainyl-CoA--carnitine CoA-transferase [Candidatus Woesearchaeota archaeon]|nr:crotonobetainyl-CoA--carnitine CoA-transferase [Candidatus Woesearchaeota archaeon]